MIRRSKQRAWMVVVLMVAVAGVSEAQSTGFPGINDMTLNGQGSGGTSCIAVTVPPGQGLTVVVTTEPFAPVFLLLSPAGCQIGVGQVFNCLTRSGRDQQTIDVPFTTIRLAGQSDRSGRLKVGVGSCPPGISFSVQAAIVYSGCGPRPETLVSQAFDVTCQ